MFKYSVVIFAFIACSAAKPGVLAPLAYSSPVVAAPVVTATSSQVIARNYNGIAASPVLAAAPFAKFVAAPVAAPLAAAPLAANYITSSFAAPLAYSAPLAAAARLGAAPLGYASPALNYASAPLVW